VLMLKSKGLNNAAAVLGGYDGLVQAGFPIEKGKPTTSTAPAVVERTEPTAVEKKVESAPTPVAQTDVTTPTTSKVTSIPASTPTKHPRRRSHRRRHRKH